LIMGPSPETGIYLDENALRLRLGKSDIHFVPVIAGSSSSKGGVTKIVVGIVIAVAAVYTAGAAAAVTASAAASQGAAAGSVAMGELAATGVTAGGLSGALSASAFSVAGMSVTFGQIAAFGAMMAFNGISQMLSPHPQNNTAGSTAADPNPSYAFTGPVNTAKQGGPVPLIYGEIEAGSIVVSSGLDVSG
jgi:predicted phage tail protein